MPYSCISHNIQLINIECELQLKKKNHCLVTQKLDIKSLQDGNFALSFCFASLWILSTKNSVWHIGGIQA